MHFKSLEKLKIKGYKSIVECELEMRRLNVLIGANGSGKSNFISFFRLIAALLNERLQLFVSKSGGPDVLLHFGRKQTESLSGELYFGNNGYKFELEPTQDNRMMFADETLYWSMGGDFRIGSGHFETEAHKDKTPIKDFTLPVMRGWRVYHFHDTSDTARVKQIHRINDNEYLREDGANLGAFLYRLQKHHSSHYQQIVTTLQMVAPFFGDFYLRPTSDNPDSIQLEWTEKDHDVPFKASELSDGTLRFMLLATVLLQPEEFMPGSIIIDEPELGLHPYAIALLADLMNSCHKDHQLIISTQSVDLISEFEIEDLIVADKKGAASTFKRFDAKEREYLQEWLEEYSVGELWKKNLLGGRPQ